MIHIIVEHTDIVEFYLANQLLLIHDYEKVAENEDIGVEIYLTNTNNHPVLSVFADGNQCNEISTSVDNLEKLTEFMYDTYLDEQNFIAATTSDDGDEGAVYFDDPYPDDMEGEAYSEEELERNLIDDRETELDAAVEDFLAVVLQTGGVIADPTMDEIHDDVKEHFLEYLARKHKIDIYRPMNLVDEDGEEFFEEYPYECLEFEDEDNPIYQ